MTIFGDLAAATTGEGVYEIFMEGLGTGELQSGSDELRRIAEQYAEYASELSAIIDLSRSAIEGQVGDAAAASMKPMGEAVAETGDGTHQAGKATALQGQGWHDAANTVEQPPPEPEAPGTADQIIKKMTGRADEANAEMAAYERQEAERRRVLQNNATALQGYWNSTADAGDLVPAEYPEIRDPGGKIEIVEDRPTGPSEPLTGDPDGGTRTSGAGGTPGIAGGGGTPGGSAGGLAPGGMSGAQAPGGSAATPPAAAGGTGGGAGAVRPGLGGMAPIPPGGVLGGGAAGGDRSSRGSRGGVPGRSGGVGSRAGDRVSGGGPRGGAGSAGPRGGQPGSPGQGGQGGQQQGPRSGAGAPGQGGQPGGQGGGAKGGVAGGGRGGGMMGGAGAGRGKGDDDKQHDRKVEWLPGEEDELYGGYEVGERDEHGRLVVPPVIGDPDFDPTEDPRTQLDDGETDRAR